MQDGSGPGGSGAPGAITSEFRLARTKSIDLHGGWAGRPPSRSRSCLEATARGPDTPVPPCPSQAQIQGALDFGGPGLVNGGQGGARGHRAQSRHSIDCI